MRDREKILQSLEGVYRGAYDEAERRGDAERMERLDFDFQRDQLLLEALLDVRELLAGLSGSDGSGGGSSLIEKAKALKDLTRLR